jgi:hypothetical protein
MKRRFTIGVLVGSLVGFTAGVCLSFLVLERFHSMMQPMERVAVAAESSEYTYQIYLYAPYPVAEFYLNQHASLLENLAEESSEESERGSFLRDLAANQARLAKLAAENGDDAKATALLAEAMTYLSDSGSSWSEEELRSFIDRLDEKNLESPSSQESAVASDKDENDA